MTRPDQRPGRRRAVPEPKPPRRAPKSPRPPREPRPPRQPGTSPLQKLSVRAWTITWFVVVLGALATLVADHTPLRVPAFAPLVGAVTVTTAYAFALAVRVGGRPLIAGGLALALSVSAVVSGVPVLLAGAAVCTAAIGAVLGVVATQPAARFSQVLREVGIAVAVASVAAFAAGAYDASLSLERAAYLVLALALLGALALVFRLGAGLQGLGTRGAVVILAGVGLLAVTIAYTEALARWGSPELIETFDSARDQVRDVLGAVPRPIEILVGFPALAWGVSTRARRRQGWWACAFGAAALAEVASSFLDPKMSLLEAGLTLGYGVGAGLALGYLVIRVDTFLSGTRGARARRAEEAAAHRPEPSRTHALM